MSYYACKKRCLAAIERKVQTSTYIEVATAKARGGRGGGLS